MSARARRLLGWALALVTTAAFAVPNACAPGAERDRAAVPAVTT